MPNYQLEYIGEGIRALSTTPFTGKVTVESQEGLETHTLWVKDVRVAEYRKRVLDTEDPGETISYIVGRRKIGAGNLLAGVLLRLGQLETKRSKP